MLPGDPDYLASNAEDDGWGDQDWYDWPEAPVDDEIEPDGARRGAAHTGQAHGRAAHASTRQPHPNTNCTGGVSAAQPPTSAYIPSAEARLAPVATPPVPKPPEAEAPAARTEPPRDADCCERVAAPSQPGDNRPPRHGRLPTDETMARQALYPDPTHIQVVGAPR